MIDLPVELLLVSTSGHTYGHYYMVLLPTLCFFAGLLLWALRTLVISWTTKESAKIIFVVGVLGIFTWTSAYYYFDQVRSWRNVNDNEVVNFITSNSKSNESVLLWGAESYINFFSERESPTRFVYQYPLYTEGYADESKINEFLTSIIQSKPRFIIDTKDLKTPFLDFKITTESINSKITIIRSNYKPVKIIGSWVIYELK